MLGPLPPHSIPHTASFVPSQSPREEKKESEVVPAAEEVSKASL